MLISRGVNKLINLGPIILLYYLSISELDTYFESFLKFYPLTFN